MRLFRLFRVPHPPVMRRLLPMSALSLALLSACTTQPPPMQAPDAAHAPEPGATAEPAEAPNLADAELLRSQQLAALTMPREAAANLYAHRSDARDLAWQIAQTHGLPLTWVWEHLAQASFRERIPPLMMPPRGGNAAKDWQAYRSRFVEPVRLRAGARFWQAHADTLARAEQQWGVPARIIVGVLGVETLYGQQTGQIRVIDALATLSLDFPQGRSDRSGFFRQELGHYLKWCHDQQRDPQGIRGSFAGAIGLPQFMPSSIRRFAVDFDGDGRIDLQASPADAIGSVAHFLARHGWQTAQPTQFAVQVPQDEGALQTLLGPDILPSFSPAEMQRLGAQLPPAALSHPGMLALVEMRNGSRPPTRVAGTANFYALTRYNQSSYYAMAVIHLGDAVAHALPAGTLKP